MGRRRTATPEVVAEARAPTVGVDATRGAAAVGAGPVAGMAAAVETTRIPTDGGVAAAPKASTTTTAQSCAAPAWRSSEP